MEVHTKWTNYICVHHIVCNLVGHYLV